MTEAADQDQPNGDAPAERTLTEREHNDFEQLLEYLKTSRGFDFTGYKRPSLVRRVSIRMKAAGVETFRDYLDFLQVDPGEFTALFDTLLINVTGFMRDPAAWELLSSDVLPGLVAAKGPSDPIRVWSVGCASPAGRRPGRHGARSG